MRRALSILAVVLALAALSSALLLRRGGAQATAADEAPAGVPALPPAVAAADGLVVAGSAHAGARLEPCGCVAGMHGGLVRRASLLARVPAARRLTVELGGWSGGGADYQLERGRFYLDALGVAGCDAIGLGRAEVALGRERLASLLTRAPAPVLAANVRAREDGALALASHAVVDKGGRRLAVTAVVPAEAAGDGLQVEDPAEALVRLLPRFAGCDVVVLADLDEAGLAELARAVPGLALVIGGEVRQPSPAPLAVGAARVVHAANEGKTLGWWPWGASACAFELIADAVPDHPAVRRIIHAYQERLGAMDLAVDDRGGMTQLAAGPVAGARYVGAATCMACHRGAASVHAVSRHAHALDSLHARNYHRDPDCLRCHVTGFGLPDGWKRSDPRAELAQVGCESCHGRGSLHVAERSAGRPASGTLEPVTPATCLRCHDTENSPRFDYVPYWEKIRHDSR